MNTEMMNNIETPKNQRPGEDFFLLPGESLLWEGIMQMQKIPAVSSTIRITENRLVFCTMPSWLFLIVPLLFLLKLSKITHSCLKEDIVHMEFTGIFGRKALLVKTRSGETLKFASLWFSNEGVEKIMQWWQSSCPSREEASVKPEACNDEQSVSNAAPKSRVTYILLGLFLGALGVHNFYAKRTGIAVAQLLINLLTLPLGGFGACITGFWALIEVFVVTKDGKGVPFK